MYGLDDCREFELIFDAPAKLAAMLADGQLDVGLIPSIEYFRFADPRGECGYRAIPGVSISSKGKVLSVKLFCKKPISEVEKVALDTSSRTSCALVKIILKERYDVRPTFTPCDLTEAPSWRDVSDDAVLTIGDLAMQVAQSELTDDCERSAGHPNGDVALDLGEEWQKLTGLPFVYAFWTARVEKGCGESLGEAAAVLQAAKCEGLRNIHRIAATESRRLGLEKDFCAYYLSDIISYDLGQAELEGLVRF